MATFDSRSKSVGELLGTNMRERLVIPTFQRGYSWVKKHVEAFWNDILQFQKERDLAGGPQKYFLGPIVTLQKPNEKIIEILDGQQRLATTTILLSVLRDIAEKTGTNDGKNFARDVQTQLIFKEDSGYSLQMGETDEPYFRDTIQAHPVARRTPSIRTHRNIRDARELLMEKVRSEVGGSNPTGTLAILKMLRQTLRSDLILAEIPVESERDAFSIFETLNDRGLRLSVPDLLLNYLMRQAKPENSRKQIRELWTEMLERMGRRDINRFLRHMWVSKYGDLKSKDLFTALKEHIENERVGSLAFARSCDDECEHYIQLLSLDEAHLGKSTKYVRSLLQELDVQAALPLLLSGIQKLKLADFEKLCKWLLVFVTRYSVIVNLDISGMETVFFKLAKEIRTMMDDPIAARRCLTHIRATLTSEAPTDESVKAAMSDLVLAPDEAGYVLSRLARRLQTNTREVTIGEANIEHIFPKNPKSNEWGGKTNHKKLEPYLWHIGNLTILGERLNRDAGNQEYSVKKKRYGARSELEMAKKIARDYTDWNEASIKDRANKLTRFVLEIWNFTNPSQV